MLEKLPRELLNAILQYHSCTSALWLCGNHALHRKLSSSVTSLSLAHIPVGPFIFPEWLPRLSNLKSLHISSPTDLVTDLGTPVDALNMLPSSLESLTIDSKDANRVLLNWEDCGSSALVAPSHSIATFLPNLKSLSLQGYKHSMHGDLLSSLPPSLTSLFLPDDMRIKLPSLSELPRSLQRFDFQLKVGYLPRAEESDAAIQKQLDDFENMPPGLIIPKISLNSHHLTNVESLAKLPTNMSELHLTKLTFAMIPHLPRSLVRLDLGVFGVDKLALQADSALKPDIEDDAGGNTVSTLTWPPTLQELVISLRACDQGQLALLPRSLRRLDLNFAVSSHAVLNFTIFAAELPPLLEELTIATRSYHVYQVSGHFPPTLTRLTTLAALPIVASNLSAALPHSIEHLNLEVCEIRTSPALNSSYTFPRNLKTLRLSTWSLYWLAEIPSSVTSLEVGILASSFPPRLGLIEHISKCLPSLTSLKMDRFISRTPTRAYLQAAQLPSLLHLTLPTTIKMLASSIKELPRALKTLVVTFEGITDDKLSDLKCLADLPPNLDKCDIFRGMSLDPDALAEILPPTLWRCLLAGPLHRMRHIARLRQRLEIGPPPPPPTSTGPSSNWFLALLDMIFK